MGRIDGLADAAGEGSGGAANERFKAGFGGVVRISIIIAALVHLFVFLLNPGWGSFEVVERYASPARELVALPEVLGAVGRPVPPDPLPRPALPVVAELDLPDEITMEPVNFESYGEFEIPPPPTSAREELAEYRHFMPFMVAPELQNRDEVRRALERSYPRRLQNMGIGGSVLIWFWIDEDGTIVNYEIKRSSGRAELDRAAEEVVAIMQFSPAFHRNRTVPVIVSLPIVFETR